MRWPAWSCVLLLLGGLPAQAAAGDGFTHHVIAARLAPKDEQAADPRLIDFYVDMGEQDGALPGTEFWVYRIERVGGRHVAIPVARLETIHVEERVSVARIEMLTMPVDEALIAYRTVMVGDAVEPILGTGRASLGDRPLPDESMVMQGPVIPTLAVTERLVRTFSIPNVVLFDFDKSTLRPEGTAVLKQVAAFIADTQARQVRVEGHTDAVGTHAYNKKLSQRRSDAVKRFLARQKGVNPKALVAVGYGETKPVASNATDAGRQRNRRSEIAVDGRPPARTALDGMAIRPEQLTPEGAAHEDHPASATASAPAEPAHSAHEHAHPPSAPATARAPASPPATAPAAMVVEDEDGRPFPELARPRS